MYVSLPYPYVIITPNFNKFSQLRASQKKNRRNKQMHSKDYPKHESAKRVVLEQTFGSNQSSFFIPKFRLHYKKNRRQKDNCVAHRHTSRHCHSLFVVLLLSMSQSLLSLKLSLLCLTFSDSGHEISKQGNFGGFMLRITSKLA